MTLHRRVGCTHIPECLLVALVLTAFLLLNTSASAQVSLAPVDSRGHLLEMLGKQFAGGELLLTNELGDLHCAGETKL
jgi:hypothetical protein